MKDGVWIVLLIFGGLLVHLVVKMASDCCCKDKYNQSLKDSLLKDFETVKDVPEADGSEPATGD